MTPQARTKILAAKLNNLTPEIRAKLFVERMGKRVTVDVRAKLSATRKLSPETRAKLLEAIRGRALRQPQV